MNCISRYSAFGLICLVTALMNFGVASAAGQSSVGRSAYSRIGMSLPPGGWSLSICADGSAQLVFGCSDGRGLPPGTFDFQQVVAQCKSMGDSDADGCCDIAFLGTDQQAVTRQPVANYRLLLPFFQKALSTKTDFPDRMQKLWEDCPPHYECRLDLFEREFSSASTHIAFTSWLGFAMLPRLIGYGSHATISYLDAYRAVYGVLVDGVFFDWDSVLRVE